MKMKILVLLLAFLVVLPSFAHAITDDPPTVTIIAQTAEGYVVSTVDTSVVLKIDASDEGFDAGISSLQLLDNGGLIQRKECFYTIDCSMILAVTHQQAGTHRFTAIVIDGGQNKKTDSVSVRFLGVNRTPTLSFVDDVEVEEQSLLSVDVKANDFDNDPITITAGALPKGAVFESNELTWRPNFNQSGDYTVRFRATDKDGYTEKTMHIKVLNLNRPPTVTTDERRKIYIYEGDEHKFYVNVTDPDKVKPTVEWRIDNRIVSTSRTFTYKPGYNAAGNHVLVAIVNDKDFVTRETWNVTVYDTNRKPVLTGLNDRTVDEGDKVRITVRAEDKDNDKITYSASNLPGNATFDPVTRMFVWQTQYKDAGTYSVVFRATDSKGDSDTKSVKITVIRKYRTRIEEYEDYLKQLKTRQKNQASNNYVNALGQNPGSIIILPQNKPQPLPLLTTPVCREGYLCYTTTYFFR